MTPDDAFKILEAIAEIQITFSVETDEEELSEREEQIKDAEYYIKKYSGGKKLSEFEQDILKRAQFILKHNCIASRYCNILDGFNLTKALVDGVFRLPDEYIENFDIDDNIYVNLAHIKKYKPSLATVKQIIIKDKGKFIRCIAPKIKRFQHQSPISDEWYDFVYGWGHPGVLAYGSETGVNYVTAKLYFKESIYDDVRDAIASMENTPSVDCICEDIFADG